MEVSEMNLADGEYTVDNRKRTGTGRNRLEQFSL